MIRVRNNRNIVDNMPIWGISAVMQLLTVGCNFYNLEKVKDLRPNKAEVEFLNLAFNRFYDIFDELMSDAF